MTKVGDRILRGLADAVAFAQAFEQIDFPKGTRVRSDREGYHVTLPDGMRLRIVVLEKAAWQTRKTKGWRIRRPPHLLSEVGKP